MPAGNRIRMKNKRIEEFLAQESRSSSGEKYKTIGARRCLIWAPLAFVMAAGIQPAMAQDRYWNGTGNGLAGNWQNPVTWWSLNAAGTQIALDGVYGGYHVIFSTTSVNTPQVSQLGSSTSAATMRFISPASTAIVGGSGNYQLQLFGGITVASGAGAVVIGSPVAGQQVNLYQQPSHSWTNNSSNLLTVHNSVTYSGTYDQHTITGTGNTLINGAIAGAAPPLVKTGSGTLTLAGANTHASTMTISGSGAVVINGNQIAATGTVSLTGAGTRLAGSGTVGGDTTIGAGSIHSPGALAGVGLQTFDKAGAAITSLTYSSTSIFSWNLDTAAAQTRGAGYDAVNVSGALGGANAIFRIVIGDSSFNEMFWSTKRTWTDIFTSDGVTAKSWASIFSGGFQYMDGSGATVSPAGQGSFSMSGNTLSWTPEAGASFVPEPSSALAGLLLALGVFRRRR